MTNFTASTGRKAKAMARRHKAKTKASSHKALAKAPSQSR